MKLREGFTPVEEQIREICSAGAGPELAGLLGVAGEAGCPVWHAVDGVVVPRMHWTSGGHRPTVPKRLLDPVTLATLTSDNLELYEALKTPTIATQMKRLTAALFIDLLGVGVADTAELLGYQWDEEHKSGVIRARGLEDIAKEGRELWARLGAWPWWYYWQPPDGKLPEGWWQEEDTLRALTGWCAHHLSCPLPAAEALATGVRIRQPRARPLGH